MAGRSQQVQYVESDALSRFREIAKQGQVVESERRPINIGVGEALLFRLDSFKVIQDRTKKDHRYMGYLGELPNGEQVIILESGNLPNFLGGVESQNVTQTFVGRIVGVACVGEQDVGKQSPMKVFEVVDFGTDWPAKPSATRRQRKPAEQAPADDNGAEPAGYGL